jgi:hypothetical protein
MSKDCIVKYKGNQLSESEFKYKLASGELKDLAPNYGQNIDYEKVEYNLKGFNKIVDNFDKVNKWFKQIGDNDKFWNKLQQDLQIPKDQVNLLKESEGNSIEDKLTSFVTNYSYTIEINTAKEGGNTGINKGKAISEARAAGLKYGTEEFENFVTNYLESKGEVYIEKNTQYHSNLTVPGGTNYTENEIATPAITPSIKGHAQFATDKGLMWSRTDEKAQYQEQDIDNLLKIMENSKILQIKCF